MHAYHDGALRHVSAYAADSPVTHGAFLPARSESTTFLLGTGAGSLYVADDTGAFARIGSIGSAVSSVFVAPVDQYVVVVSVQAVMFVYQVRRAGGRVRTGRAVA